MPPQFHTHEDFRNASTAELIGLCFKSTRPRELESERGLRAFYERAPKTAGERRLHAAAELARRAAYEEQLLAEPLSSPKATREYLIRHFMGRVTEVFSVIFLDNRHRVRSIDDLFFGTVDGASVHPREVVRRALERGAAAVILTHNHPSYVAEPSHADELITTRLREALALVDIRVLDHLIVAGSSTISFAERGLL